KSAKAVQTRGGAYYCSMSRDLAKPQPRDMMLIPAPLPPNVFSQTEAEVFNHNRTWSSQWRAKRPGERGTVEIATRATLAAVISAFRQAAAQARSKEVILFA